MRKILALFLLLAAAGSGLALAQKDPTARSRNQPAEPFKIAGNLYYVGASDIAAYLIATPDGLILLDGGFEETAPLIRASVEKLGFHLKDVKFLLNSHAHFDHAGGLAALKKGSGAKLVASAKDAPLLAHGGKGDFRFGDTATFPPVPVDRIVRDGERVTLGGTTLVAHLTPGHTQGCTTWTARIADGGRTLDAVFVCSTSILPGDRLTAMPKYPAMAADYVHTLETLKALPCDLFLASHGGFFHLAEKATRLRAGEKANPFVDPAGYREYLREAGEKLGRQLAEEKAQATKPAGSSKPAASSSSTSSR
jgi:metallo-beta-lactamase class B